MKVFTNPLTGLFHGAFEFLCVVMMGLALGAISEGAQGEGSTSSGSGESRSQLSETSFSKNNESSERNTAESVVDVESFVSRQRRPWSLAWFNWASVNKKYLQDGEERLETYNYLSFDYRLSRESQLSLRPEFYINGAGRNFEGHQDKSEIDRGDIYLQYTHNQWALWPTFFGDVGVKGALRVYYPNSQTAELQKQISKIQLRTMMDLPLGNGFWLIYHFRPQLFVQRQRAYKNEFLKTKANENYRLEQRLELVKSLSSQWSVSQSVGVEHRRYYAYEPRRIEAKTDGFFSMDTGLAWSSRGVMIRGGISYESKVTRPGRNKNLYNDLDSQYFLMTFLSL